MSGEEREFQHQFFETTSVRDFLARPRTPPPAGYPIAPHPDQYSPDCFEPVYEKRRAAFVDHCLRNPAAETIKGFYYELVRIGEGAGPIYEGAIEAAIDYVAERYDCADFVLLGIERLLLQFGDSDLVSERLRSRAKEVVLGFKYWPDEPGIDSMCSWTENHQIMFSTNEFLAGQLYPETRFSNSGSMGSEKRDRARGRILDWLELRFKTGFNEWLSNVYYDEDLTALINLVDFSQDREIAERAAAIADLLLFDVAVNSFRGCFVSSHGRSYSREKSNATFESTTDTSKLLFGRGRFSGADNMSAVTLALSRGYRMPKVLFEVANDNRAAAVTTRQRAGINIDEARRWGIEYDDPAGAMKLLSFEAYAHPKTFAATLRMFDEYRWWQNQFFEPFAAKKGLIQFLRRSGLHHLVTRLFRHDLTRNTREEVNLYTYRTPDYQLSSAVDYHPGYGGDQQHIWQATLGSEAVCFTTHPGSYEDSSCGFWTGSGTLPRVAQLENVLIAVYRISKMPGLYRTNRLFFTHAWLPVERFDEVVDSGGWTFARKGEAYLALYASRPHAWYAEPAQGEAREAMQPAAGSGARSDSPPAGAVEMRAAGETCIWICELGSRAESGTFEEFRARLFSAAVAATASHLSVRFTSPSVGRLDFGWRGPFKRNGEAVPLDSFPRYENPYCTGPFPPERISIECGDDHLTIDWPSGTRRASGYL